MYQEEVRMESFHYYSTTRIEMGPGKTEQLPELLDSLAIGSSIMIVSDPGVVQAGLVTPIQTALESARFHVTLFDAITQNPRDTACIDGAQQFKENNVDAVVAIGGGSAMDVGKVIALMGPNGGALEAYVDGSIPYKNIAPIICIPTTAGTGSEVTRSAVITATASHRKLTLKHSLLRPTMAVLDPYLTFTVPPSVTAATGVDALVHAIEGYTCKVTNPISQALGARAMQTIVSALPVAFRDGQNEKARYEMLEGSLLAGLCFGSADVAAVHCLAEAIGGLYDTPHGIANAVFLPYVLRFNATENSQVHATLARYMRFAKDSDTDNIAVEKLISGIEAFTANLQIPKLKDLPCISEEDFPKIVDLALHNGSTPNNVRSISATDYMRILEEAYDC